jgi:hypothetical protein
MALLLPGMKLNRWREKWKIYFKTASLVLLVIISIVLAVQRNLSQVRGFDWQHMADYLEHRILVQQGQSWWMAVNRIYTLGDWKPAEAFSYVFINPLSQDGGNRVVQYLMYRDIENDAFAQFEAGGQYTGGYPELILELFGPWLSFPVAYLLSLLIMGLLYLFVDQISQGRFLGPIAFSFCFKPMYSILVGASLNFLTWRFPLKIIIMIAVIEFERRYHKNRKLFQNAYIPNDKIR